jgi:hypothetical protein
MKTLSVQQPWASLICSALFRPLLVIRGFLDNRQEKGSQSRGSILAMQLI